MSLKGRSGIVFRAFVLFVLGLAATWAAAVNPQEGLTDTQRRERIQAVEEMAKVDAHAHVYAISPDQEAAFGAFLTKHKLQWLDICTGGMKWDRLRAKMEIAGRLARRYPGRVSWAPSFNLTNWGRPSWKDEALATISEGFAAGAVAVKVWKEIGMELRDPDGSYVMIDDPRLAPVFDLIEKKGRTLVAHIGEPRNCWLPLDKMTTDSDRRYFGSHPEYHGFLHPEIPDHEKQMAARDHLLEMHPRLKVVGCHLGSLEYDVDELARRLEKYPNFAVDISARLVHLQIQPREKVRAFVMKYQDRLLYGTDMGFGSETGEAPTDPAQAFSRLEQAYQADATWLATDMTVAVTRAGPTVKSRGLALPLPVLRKIYRENARRWYGI